MSLVPWPISILTDRRRSMPHPCTVLVLLIALVTGGLVSQQALTQTVLVPEQTMVRVIHASPDAPPLDVYIDDRLLSGAMAFGNLSGYLPIETGDQELQVVPAGGDPLRQALFTVELTFAVDTFQLLAIQNYLSGITLSAYEQDLSRIDGQGIARIRLIHLVPDANGLTMALPNGDALFDSVVPMTASRYKDILAGSQSIRIRPERQEIIAEITQPLALLPNADYDIVVIGQLRDDSVRVLPLVVATAQPCGQFLGIGGPASGCLRVVNASPDIPAIDVYAGDLAEPVVAGLTFGVVSPVISVPSGDIDIRIVPAGGAEDSELATTSLYLENGNGQLLVSSGPADRAVLQGYDDSGQPLGGDQVRVSVVHQANHTGMLDVTANGEPLVQAILESEESDSRLVPAGTYVFAATTNPDGEQVTESQPIVLVAGMAYQIIVAGDADEGLVAVVPAGLPVPVDTGIPAP